MIKNYKVKRICLSDGDRVVYDSPLMKKKQLEIEEKIPQRIIMITNISLHFFLALTHYTTTTNHKLFMLISLPHRERVILV